MYVLFNLLIIFWIVARITRTQDVSFIDPPSRRLVGSPCFAKDGGRGICTDFLKCPGIRETILTNPPANCGFNGLSPIVCCPVVGISPVDLDPLPATVLDISPPSSSSSTECGRNAIKFIFPNLRSKRAKDLATVAAAPIDITASPPVVGGFESQRNAWPWMALIGIKEEIGFNWFCGGVLINDLWVLTAAHCLDTRIPTTVRLGEHNYEDLSDDSNEEDFEISEHVRYPNYSFPVAYNDLALLRLKTKVILKRFISPVCLPWGVESQKNLTGRSVKLTGWGDTQFRGSPSAALQEVDLTMFPTSLCQRAYSDLRQFRVHWPKDIGQETVCAGHESGGRDACQGDSGGPLTYLGGNGRYFLSGIVSTGYGCGNKNFPGIYANVLYAPHLAWIKKVAF
ncbi:trypsin-like [Palaemon carinicauda]|uniref:trypsin-like n=1 Tax=Palaemon carinicauda TaxID=392227 RepID=UPI0035B699E2